MILWNTGLIRNWSFGLKMPRHTVSQFIVNVEDLLKITGEVTLAKGITGTTKFKS